MLVDRRHFVGFARTRRFLSNLEISRKKIFFGRERCDRCPVAGLFL